MLVPRQVLAQLRRSRFLYGAPSTFGHGDRRSRQSGEGLEFEEYRSYEPNDDFRQVDPAVFLRTGQYQVKRYAVERAIDVSVLLDISESMEVNSSKLSLARQMAACLAYIALVGGDRVRLGLFGGRQEWSPVLQGPARFQYLSDWLSARRRVGGPLESRLLEAAVLNGPVNRGLVFLVSDCLIEGIEEVLLRIRSAGFDVVVLQLMSPEEMDPGLLGMGRMDLLDSETGELVEGDLGEETLAEYQQVLTAWNSSIEESLLSPDRYFLTRSDSSLQEVVFGQWRARGLVR